MTAAQGNAWLNADLVQAAKNQRRLLEMTPLEIAPALDISVFYEPLRAIGGDFYCVKKISEKIIGTLIADVSGKGIQAALLMAAAHAHLQHFLTPENDAAQILRKFNAAMTDTIPLERFITACVALFDLEKNTVNIARAGHETPFLLLPRKNDTAEHFARIKTNGMPVGLVPAADFDAVLDQVTLPFPEGAILTLFSDGLTETLNDTGEFFDETRACEILRENDTATAKEINDALVSAAKNFSKKMAPEDDLTLLTVKARPA